MDEKTGSVSYRDLIEHHLIKNGKVSVNELSESFGVSKETIRRRLNDLEAQGIAKRVHGGAVLAEQVGGQQIYKSRSVENFSSKQKIGEAAARMVNDGDTIFLDSSTTCLCLARHLADKRVTIITNSVQILFEVMKLPNLRVISTGGIVRPKEMDFYGEYAERGLDTLCAQKTFFSATGFDLTTGATSSLEVEARLQRAMIKNTETSIFLCDHSKFGKVGYNRVAGIDEISYLITDMPLPAGWGERLDGLTKVILCD